MTDKPLPQRVPFLDHCGIERTFRENGVCRARVEPAPERLNRVGAMHGGLLMTLLDCVLAGACTSTLPEGQLVATVDMQAAFLKPGRGALEAEGRLLRSTRSLMFTEGEVRDSSGEIVAKASGQFWVIDGHRARAHAEKA